MHNNWELFSHCTGFTVAAGVLYKSQIGHALYFFFTCESPKGTSRLYPYFRTHHQIFQFTVMSSRLYWKKSLQNHMNISALLHQISAPFFYLLNSLGFQRFCKEYFFIYFCRILGFLKQLYLLWYVLYLLLKLKQLAISLLSFPRTLFSTIISIYQNLRVFRVNLAVYITVLLTWCRIDFLRLYILVLLNILRFWASIGQRCDNLCQFVPNNVLIH